MVVGYPAKEMLKTFYGMGKIILKIWNVMGTRIYTGCSAAGEYGFCFPCSRFKDVIFKK